jgi:maltose alpha-D-glucosyltransferase/alpha-amylase
MLRSFHYAEYASLISLQERGLLSREDFLSMEVWAQYWDVWVSGVFMRAYLALACADNFLPRTRDELRMLLDLYLLEKAIYELGYELNNRPGWVQIPLQGIGQLLGQGK